ncbi:RNA-directed DNA polymerase, eukaryota, reverse transcriptase zinc-binding domain protein [Tanacetum coccineum]
MIAFNSLFSNGRSLVQDRRKEGSVRDKGSLIDGAWRWEWNWVRSIRGRVSREYEELIGVLQNVVDPNHRDKWRWTLGVDGVFLVRDLAKLIEEKVLRVESGGEETIWNNLVPKKVNIFVWRALRGRLPVRVELDRREIDLDSVLCPCCNNIVETCSHSLVTCDLATSVWDKVFKWWKVGDVNVFTTGEIFASSGGVHVPNSLTRIWKAVMWTSGYFIWKERNARVFERSSIAETNALLKKHLCERINLVAETNALF